MNSKILEQVKSPFQDELIHELIKKYISCGCDDNLFYSEINGLKSDKMNTDSFTNTLINKIYSQGVEKSEVWSMTDEEKNHLPFIYNKNNSWIIVYSEEEPMQDNQRNSNNQRTLRYRIYLNLKGKEKADFVENYMKVCQDKEVPFEFKFSIDNSRCDQIVILSRLENFEENISIVEELTRKIQLGNLPMLIGEYKNNIGIAEEYYNRLYSPTTAKLALVRSSVKKYLCDHKDEFYEQLSEEEKEKIDEYVEYFSYTYDTEKAFKEELGKDYEDLSKKYYQRKSSIDCAREHIENDSGAYICGTGLLDLGNAIQQIYSNNPEQFVNEVTQNYRMIGTQVWGFSQDFVFSNETEEKFLQSKESETILSAEQIGSELEVISREGIANKTQADLIAMLKEEKKQKGIGR